MSIVPSILDTEFFHETLVSRYDSESKVFWCVSYCAILDGLIANTET